MAGGSGEACGLSVSGSSSVRLVSASDGREAPGQLLVAGGQHSTDRSRTREHDQGVHLPDETHLVDGPSDERLLGREQLGLGRGCPILRPDARCSRASAEHGQQGDKDGEVRTLWLLESIHVEAACPERDEQPVAWSVRGEEPRHQLAALSAGAARRTADVPWARSESTFSLTPSTSGWTLATGIGTEGRAVGDGDGRGREEGSPRAG